LPTDSHLPQIRSDGGIWCVCAITFVYKNRTKRLVKYFLGIKVDSVSGRTIGMPTGNYFLKQIKHFTKSSRSSFYIWKNQYFHPT
jgi:hypothetical protein